MNFFRRQSQFCRFGNIWIPLALLIICGVVGLFGLQGTEVFKRPYPPAISQAEARHHEEQDRGTSTHVSMPDTISNVHRGSSKRDVSSVNDTVVNVRNDPFYRTIIDNNLFAPLGTVLNAKPKPESNLTLVATFVSTDALRSTALIKNKTTGRHYRLAIGDVIEDFTVMKIQSKQVTLDHHGNPPVRLHLPENVFLN